VNHSFPLLTHKFFNTPKIPKSKFCITFVLILLIGCSSTKRLTTNNNVFTTNAIRVLLENSSSDLAISVNDLLIISDEEKVLAKVKAGNKLFFNIKSEKIILKIGEREFFSKNFFITGSDEADILKINNKKYRGRIVISINNSEIKIVNQIGLEDYVKGVMIKEMPIGKGLENYQALKAFSICVRTFAFNKMQENKSFFDVYPDTRDQVYGGVEGESEMTNQIVDETDSQLLFFDNKPATIFYHSTCGGQTENVSNVFGKSEISYLAGIKDGEEPYCKISPRYKWVENYTQTVFINRLFKTKLIDSENFNIVGINVKSRFKSGRVDELEINLSDFDGNPKIVTMRSNQIRSIIRDSEGKSILKSTLFDIRIDEQNNIIISGKGNGHGVGLCQWGAIGQSRSNIDFRKILNHYYPGTEIKNIYD
jgi:stage II sporulation protein D